MKILLSNDDGVHAPGLRILYEELSKIASVKVIAPLEEMSTTGHSLSLTKPLRLIPMQKDFYGVSGSPADCVYVGIKEVLKNKPDLVVSGINRGANLGQDVYYSGTVSAAREGCMMGIPSFAVSLDVDFKSRKPESKLHYDSAAKIAVKIIEEYYKKGFPKHTLININVPDLPKNKIKGIKPARQGFRHYGSSVLKRVDHRGKDYFWVGGQYSGYAAGDDTDCAVVDKGFVAITPLKLDVTDMAFLEEIKREAE
jgi:5'-nucleotidase